MQSHFNFLLLPLVVPLILGGKAFLDHQDFKMAFEAMVSKRTIIFTLLTLFIVFIMQIAIGSH